MGKAGEVKAEPDTAEGWSAWRRIDALPPCSSEVLAETLDGGQAFRWHRQPDATWRGQWAGAVVRLRLSASGSPEWSAPHALEEEAASALPRYFSFDLNYAALTDSLPWRSDPHLAQCIHAFPGLRLLRQPFGETLLGFLCSATKQIVQIKQMMGLLAERHGTPMHGDAATRRSPHSQAATRGLTESARSSSGRVTASETYYRLPTWEQLADVPESTLRECLLGFRARYIAETARFLAGHPGWLEETETLPYPIAKERLCSLPGVGEKVADCVLLFGAGRLEAFPVDVWILKTLARRYGLDGWRPAQLAQFGRAHFGPLAGLAQQFLFAWERKQKHLARAEPSAG